MSANENKVDELVNAIIQGNDPVIPVRDLNNRIAKFCKILEDDTFRVKSFRFKQGESIFKVEKSNNTLFRTPFKIGSLKNQLEFNLPFKSYLKRESIEKKSIYLLDTEMLLTAKIIGGEAFEFLEGVIPFASLVTIREIMSFYQAGIIPKYYRVGDLIEKLLEGCELVKPNLQTILEEERELKSFNQVDREIISQARFLNATLVTSNKLILDSGLVKCFFLEVSE